MAKQMVVIVGVGRVTIKSGSDWDTSEAPTWPLARLVDEYASAHANAALYRALRGHALTCGRVAQKTHREWQLREEMYALTARDLRQMLAARISAV